MSGAQWFTADTHFDHQFVAGLRGYDNAQEHDEAIVRSWNKRVRPDDTVWHLGDVGIGALPRSAPWLAQLNGTIHLITGNHDQVAAGVHRNAHKHNKAWLTHFASISQFARIRINRQDVLLSHYPYGGEGDRDLPERYSQFRLKNEGLPLIHGHTHSNTKVTRNNRSLQIHVGWDAWRRPVNLGEIVQIMDQVEDETLAAIAELRLKLTGQHRASLQEMADELGLDLDEE